MMMGGGPFNGGPMMLGGVPGAPPAPPMPPMMMGIEDNVMCVPSQPSHGHVHVVHRTCSLVPSPVCWVATTRLSTVL
jgi:hypothetical protein